MSSQVEARVLSHLLEPTFLKELDAHLLELIDKESLTRTE